MSKNGVSMLVGIDFDNTIISYDTVFNRVGIERGMIPSSLARGKGHVRDFLRKQGKEKDWIWLQGYVYGTQLHNADIYEGVKEFLEFCRRAKIECVIVSHKTRYPYSGEKYDLHSSAYEWIKDQSLGIDVFFELTKEEKVKRIGQLNCSFFIDDLPEFLALEGFSEKLVKILFDPLSEHGHSDYGYLRAGSWKEIQEIFQQTLLHHESA
ncbi:MAG: hypothetical protein WC836_23475 [Desulfobacula sp.]|jgi:hypothetical protein